MSLDAEGIYIYDELDTVTTPTLSAFLNQLANSVSARFAAGRPPRPIMTRVKSSVADNITSALAVQKFETLDVASNVTGKLEYDAATGEFVCKLPGLVRVAAQIAFPTPGSTQWVNTMIQHKAAIGGAITGKRIKVGHGLAGAASSNFIEAHVPVAANDRVRVMRQCQPATLAVIAIDSSTPATFVTVEYADVY